MKAILAACAAAVLVSCSAKMETPKCYVPVIQLGTECVVAAEECPDESLDGRGCWVKTEMTSGGQVIRSETNLVRCMDECSETSNACGAACKVLE